MKIIPFESNGKTITGANIQAPITQTIAQTLERAREDVYGAMSLLAVGSVASLIDEDGREISDRAQIKAIMQVAPFRNIEAINIKGLLASGVDDVIEGAYPCPKCKKVHYTAEPNNEDPENDDADRIRRLKMNIPDAVPFIFIELTEPIEKVDADTGEVLESIDSLKLRSPTVDDLTRAANRVGINNPTILNCVTYAQATLEVNGKKTDQKWKSEWGQWVYERLSRTDTRKIKDEIARYGLDTTMEHICRGCGKKWSAEVDTGSFFATGLEV